MISEGSWFHIILFWGVSIKGSNTFYISFCKKQNKKTTFYLHLLYNFAFWVPITKNKSSWRKWLNTKKNRLVHIFLQATVWMLILVHSPYLLKMLQTKTMFELQNKQEQFNTQNINNRPAWIQDNYNLHCNYLVCNTFFLNYHDTLIRKTLFLDFIKKKKNIFPINDNNFPVFQFEFLYKSSTN